MSLPPSSSSWRTVASALCLALVLSGCSLNTPQTPSRAAAPAAAEGRQLDPQQAERLKSLMTSLLQKMNHPIPLDQVRIGLMDDSHINAANAGGGEFYVTTGLLLKADDEQLAGVLAHEVAHADLGHVTNCRPSGPGRILPLFCSARSVCQAQGWYRWR